MRSDDGGSGEHAFEPLQHLPPCHPSMRDRPSNCPALVDQNGAAVENRCQQFNQSARVPASATKCKIFDCSTDPATGVQCETVDAGNLVPCSRARSRD